MTRELADAVAVVTGAMRSDDAERHIRWMVGRPTDWSGNTVGFDDITARGGPPTPAHSTPLEDSSGT